MKRKMRYFFLMLLLAVTLTACGKEAGKKYEIYYLNISATAISAEQVELENGDAAGTVVVKELLELLGTEPDNGKLRWTLTEELKNPKIAFGADTVTLDFPEAYSSLSPTEEILTRAAIVRTLTQAEGVRYVNILINGEPLRYSTGAAVGPLSADDFIENPGAQINSSVEDTVVLYFSNAEGTGLVRTERKIHYTSNQTLEKTIVKLLIEGPQTTGLKGTLPSATNIINVTLADDICYVNLDDTFRNNQDDTIQEAVVLYSIVDSLTELEAVNKVQISVNGDSTGKVRYTLDLGVMYSADLSLVEEQEESGQDALTDSTEAKGGN